MDLLFDLPTKIFFKRAMEPHDGGLTGAATMQRRRSRAACDRQGAGTEEKAADTPKQLCRKPDITVTFDHHRPDLGIHR
jgi:hypothetical protein